MNIAELGESLISRISPASQYSATQPTHRASPSNSRLSQAIAIVQVASYECQIPVVQFECEKIGEDSVDVGRLIEMK